MILISMILSHLLIFLTTISFSIFFGADGADATHFTVWSFLDICKLRWWNRFDNLAIILFSYHFGWISICLFLNLKLILNLFEPANIFFFENFLDSKKLFIPEKIINLFLHNYLHQAKYWSFWCNNLY